MGETDNRSVRILVVDADVEAGQRHCETLFNAGFAAEFSSSPERALQMARHRPPQLMIVDTDLNGTSGYEFVETFENEHVNHSVAVIFVSASGSVSSVDRARDAGGLYFLNKPIDQSVLLELVDKALWMPHLIRRHVDASAHPAGPRPPRVFSDIYATRTNSEQ